MRKGAHAVGVERVTCWPTWVFVPITVVDAVSCKQVGCSASTFNGATAPTMCQPGLKVSCNAETRLPQFSPAPSPSTSQPCYISTCCISAGKTGFPFVDANMRELLATGFMSNRGRQNVASFLTKVGSGKVGTDLCWKRRNCGGGGGGGGGGGCGCGA